MIKIQSQNVTEDGPIGKLLPDHAPETMKELETDVNLKIITRLLQYVLSVIYIIAVKEYIQANGFDFP